MVKKFLVLCVMASCLASLLVGYYDEVIPNAALLITKDLHIPGNILKRLSTLLKVYSVIGCLIAGVTSDFVGRRYTMAITGIIFLIGATVISTTKSYGLFMFGLSLIGAASGFALNVIPVYIAEIAPASERGVLSSCPEAFINIGKVISYLSMVVFSSVKDEVQWRLMLGLGVIASLLLVLSSFFLLPESPRWLVMKGRLGDAYKALYKLIFYEEIEPTLTYIRQAAGIPTNARGNVVVAPIRFKVFWRELTFHRADVRRVLIFVLLLHFFQQMTGIDVVARQGTEFMINISKTSQRHPILISMILPGVKTLFILAPLILVDRLGRCLLIIPSLPVVFVSVGILGFNLSSNLHFSNTVVAVISIVCFFGSFSFGIGPIAWISASEALPFRLRSQGASVGVVLNRSTSIILSLVPFTDHANMEGTLLACAITTVIGWCLYYRWVGETRDRTLEDIETEGIIVET